MNANELADLLEEHPIGKVDKEAATMLRQQQAENEALKKQCADIHENGAQVIDKCDKKIEELIEELNVLRESYDKLWDTASQQQKQLELHKNAHHEALKFAVIPLTEDECEAIINKHDWFSKSWREMAKEIHDAILKKASK